jgi:hypothetical protein
MKIRIVPASELSAKRGLRAKDYVPLDPPKRKHRWVTVFEDVNEDKWSWCARCGVLHFLSFDGTKEYHLPGKARVSRKGGLSLGERKEPECVKRK